MTRTTNARIAGVTYLLYIVIGVTNLMLGGATSATGIGPKLALIAQHASQVRIEALLSVLTGFIAITLGVALYGLTRDEDHELAVIGLACRVCEGFIGVFPLATLGLLWLATASAGANVPGVEGAHTLAAFLVKMRGWQVITAATLFAVGSSIFSCLFLRGRMIPRSLAWLGVAASVLLVVLLPLQLIGVLRGPIVQLMWLPMALFEIPLGFWLIIKGAASRVVTK